MYSIYVTTVVIQNSFTPQIYIDVPDVPPNKFKGVNILLHRGHSFTDPMRMVFKFVQYKNEKCVIYNLYCDKKMM